jgi:hypothetical protein
MTKLVVRGVVALFGACAIVWAINAIPAYRADAFFAENARLMLSGEKFNAAQLNAVKRELDAAFGKPQQASASIDVATIRLLLLESALNAANRQPPASDLAEVQTAVAGTLAQSPTSSLMWLADLWLMRLSGQFADTDWNLLRMSYWSGRNEAWIAARRNPLAIGVFQSLPGDLAEQALSEFVGLVRSGFYTDASNILAGPGWAIHEQLLSRLAPVDEASRRAFAKVLAAKDLDGVTVPGVEVRRSRPF